MAWTVKNLPAMQETWVQSLGREDPPQDLLEWLPTPVFLPGEFHEQRSLAGYSPWGFTAKGVSHTSTCIHSPPNHLPSRLSHNVEQGSMCYPGDPYLLPILNIAVCT